MCNHRSYLQADYTPRTATELWLKSPMNPANRKRKTSHEPRETREMQFIEDTMR